MRRIETDADVAEGLAALSARDPRLAALAARTGPLPLRRLRPDFGGLAEMVVSQLVSRQATAAILARMTARLGALSGPAILAAGDDPALGLTRAKARTLQAIARAEAEGRLDLAALADLPEDVAIARLTALPGIGRWTAEVFLLIGAGAPDIFPAGDLALRRSVASALDLPVPEEGALRVLASGWAPWRSVAARLFWAHHALGSVGKPAGGRAEP